MFSGGDDSCFIGFVASFTQLTNTLYNVCRSAVDETEKRYILYAFFLVVVSVRFIIINFKF